MFLSDVTVGAVMDGASDGGSLCFGRASLWEKTSCGPTRGCLWSYSYVTETQTVVRSRQREEVFGPRVIFSIFCTVDKRIGISDLTWNKKAADWAQTSTKDKSPAFYDMQVLTSQCQRRWKLICVHVAWFWTAPQFDEISASLDLRRLRDAWFLKQVTYNHGN